MAKLECKNLCKNYGNKTVLNELNLTLESGKIYGLIGRNGAGKTTLLSILTNQNPLSGGSVTLDGEPVWENRKALDRMCFSRELNVTPESGLAAYKVKQYLKTASIFYKNWDGGMASSLIAEFGLEEKAKLSKLSKGMLSMLTITVALASKAEFTFLDEPVAGLDVVARERFYQLLLEEYERSGRTFVISTHIIEEAANVLEKVIFLDGGKILRMEDTQALVDSARYVSGMAEQVDGAVAGLECHHPETMGRSKGVTVLLHEGQSLNPGCDVTVQPVSLQKIFIALCGEEIHL